MFSFNATYYLKFHNILLFIYLTFKLSLALISADMWKLGSIGTPSKPTEWFWLFPLPKNWAGWCNGIVLDLYYGGTWFEFRAGHRLFWPKFSVFCLSPLRKMLGQYCWRIWPLLGNVLVNMSPRLNCQQQKKAWKPEWSTVRRRFTKQHTRYNLNCWRLTHDNDFLKHVYHGYVKWNSWKRWFLYGSPVESYSNTWQYHFTFVWQYSKRKTNYIEILLLDSTPLCLTELLNHRPNFNENSDPAAVLWHQLLVFALNWRMSSSGMWRCVDLASTDVASIFRRCVPPKRRLTQDLRSATSQKTTFFIVTAVKASTRTLS
jgi:hypothetical protein